MAKVESSELNNKLISSKLQSYLDKLIETRDKVSDFNIKSDETLIGGGYDAIRIKLNLYVIIFGKLITVMQRLSNSLQNANNGMLGYMQGYESLDDSKLTDLKNSLSQVEAYISYLESCQSQKETTKIDYSGAINHWKEVRTELKKLIELLEGLQPKDKELYTSLESLITDADNVLKACNGINETTFTKDGIAAFKEGKGFIYQFEPKINFIDYRPDFTDMDAWKNNNIYYEPGDRLTGQCTYFAAGFFYQIYGYQPGFSGNGCTCAKELVNAHPDKFELTNSPTPGSVFSLLPSSSHPYGHVGMVLDVDNEAGTITIIDGNYNGHSDGFGTNTMLNDWGIQTKNISEFGSAYGGVEYANPIN